MSNLEVERHHNAELTEENSDKQSHLDMKQIKIDELEKQLKSIAKKYPELRQKVCTYIRMCVHVSMLLPVCIYVVYVCNCIIEK